MPGLLSGGTTVQSRGQELIPRYGGALGGSWAGAGHGAVDGGRWRGSGSLRLDWACVLVTPQQGRVSSLSHFLRTSYLQESMWMLHSCTISLLPVVGRAKLPPEALKENLFPCIFQLLELQSWTRLKRLSSSSSSSNSSSSSRATCVSWLMALSPSSKPDKKHLQISLCFHFHVTFSFLVVVYSSCLVVQSRPTLLWPHRL